MTLVQHNQEYHVNVKYRDRHITQPIIILRVLIVHTGVRLSSHQFTRCVRFVLNADSKHAVDAQQMSVF